MELPRINGKPLTKEQAKRFKVLYKLLVHSIKLDSEYFEVLFTPKHPYKIFETFAWNCAFRVLMLDINGVKK